MIIVNVFVLIIPMALNFQPSGFVKASDLKEQKTDRMTVRDSAFYNGIGANIMAALVLYFRNFSQPEHLRRYQGGSL